MLATNPFSLLETLDSSLGKLSFPLSSSNKDRSRYNLGQDRLLVVNTTVFGQLPATAMIDSGASALFIDSDFIKQHGLTTRLRDFPQQVILANGKEETITSEIEVPLLIDQHLETVTCQVMKLSGYTIILGKPWLGRHDPSIKWSKNVVSFTSPFCQANCLPTRPPTLPENPSPRSNIPMVTSVTHKACQRLIKKRGWQLFAVSVEEVTKHIDSRERISSMTPEELEEEMRQKIPSKFHDLLPLFLKASADKLPPHRYVDHAIELEDGKKPPFSSLYSMSDLELKALREYLDEHLSKEFIRPSTSSSASPIFFVRKPDGSGIRLCVDYRELNSLTKKNRYPLPRIDDTLRQLQGSKVFTRLDLRGAFNLIRIREGDESLTAFRTRYGLFEYTVMPFGLTNAPATCQQFVNDVLRLFLDRFCVVYLDDVLIYSKNEQEHESHVRQVLEALLKAGLYVKGEKCEFSVTTTKYLGFIVTPDGLTMDPAKVEAVKNWPVPQNVTEVQSFLGFANFYRRFIDKYSRIAASLFTLLRKDRPFAWTNKQQTSFDKLKHAFSSFPILRHFDPDLETVLETDSSDLVISGILSQWFTHPDGKRLLHPVAYFSRKMIPAEQNYGIGDKELLAIVETIKEWSSMIVNLRNPPLLVYTDHSNLTSFATKKILNRREARWAMELQEYDFKIMYRPGSSNKRADALTRQQSRNQPLEGKDKVPLPILGPEKFQLSALETTLVSKIRSALEFDSFGHEVLHALETGAPRHKLVDLGSCALDSDGLLTVNNFVYIPDSAELRLQIIQSHHSHPAAGHPGASSTFELVTRNFWWPKMRDTIKQFVRNCEVCSRIKPARHAPYGFLKPLEVPQRRWTDVSFDLITHLPDSEGFTAILVVVDRLTKMGHFIPTHDELDSETFAKLYRNNIFRLHGLADTATSDRGSIFTSEYTRALASLLQITPKLSTAYHPQTDGQTERINQILEQYLRAYTSYQQDDWVNHLSLAEFAYNNSPSATTKVTPFFANYGFHPRYQILHKPETTLPAQPEIQEFQDRMEKLSTFLRSEIRFAQDIQAEQANKHRIPPPVFKVGQRVWLLRKFISTTRPSSKLDFKRLGPFPITRKISTHAYELELPNSVKLHPVFNVSLLEPTANDPLPGQKQVSPPPVIVNGEEEYLIEEILDVRKRYRQAQYLVRWTGYAEATWEPYEHVKDTQALDKFYQRYPDKLRPT